MIIESEHSDSGEVVLHVQGSLSDKDRWIFQGAAFGFLDHHPNSLEINLGKCEFIDSSGLMALQKIRDRACAAGCKFSLADLTENMQTLFELTELKRVFNIR